MSTGTRIALFALAVLVAGGVGAVLGGAVPGLRGGDDNHAHGEPAPPGDDAHADHGPGAWGPDTGAGLAVTDGGLTLRADDSIRAAPGAGRFAFRITDPGGRAITDFDESHERRMHLIVASRDLAHYRHVHPQMDAEGRWSVALDLPAAGAYRAFADFSHAGLPRTLSTDVLVDGAVRARPLPAASATARGDGYTAAIVRRTDDDGAVTLRYMVRRGAAPATGIRPYLGASAHVVALREGDMDFVHAHAEDQAGDDGALDVTVHPPSPGRYRVFIEFQHAGAVRTVAHTLEVAP